VSDLALLYIPVDKTRDGDNFTADVQFRDSESGELSAPGTVDFRIDCITNDQEVLGWTSATADDTVSIAIASIYNAIIMTTNPSEIKQLTVTGDRGQTFQCTAQKRWTVLNLDLGA
jgi:hypothetical protein